jgi:RHS repeat-associated protein
VETGKPLSPTASPKRENCWPPPTPSAPHTLSPTWSREGLLISRTSPTVATTRYEIDAGGTLSGIIDPLGNRSSFTRDLLGNILNATSPTGAQTSYSYDAASRLVRVTRASGAEVHLTWDNEGNLTRYRDELGHETRLEYTGIGELAKRTNPDGTTVTCRYDGEERLASVTNERGETIRITRDEAGRITGRTDYRGNLTRYQWDAAGTLAQQIDPLGNVTAYSHDPLGRITEKLFSDGSKEEYRYDANGNLVKHQNGTITVERTFDDEGRLTRETRGDFFVESEYDLAGRRTKRTSSHGNTVEYAYDPAGNVSGITINGRTVANIDRNSLGLPTKETLPNNISRNYRYDIQGRLLTESLFGTSSRWEREYRYDKAGNLVTRKDPLFGESCFSYDPMGRVKQATDPEGGIHHFLHDPAGDLLKSPKQRNLEVIQRFDANGNLVEREGKRQTTRFIWDKSGRLTQARHGNGTATTMAYDALGRRISKETDNKKTAFFWDGDRMLSDCAPNEKPREFVYYPGSFIPFAVIEGNGKIRYYHNDIAGLPQEVRDEEGNILWQARYDAMGKVVRLTGRRRFDNPIRFQGQYYDEELGLCYNRHRYFDPETCAFISQDPLGLAAGTNLYAYAPNVWGWVDPLGLCNTSRFTYDAMNPGPLPDKIAGTFAGGRYSEGVTESGQIFYKGGDAANPGGSFFNFEPPASRAQVYIDNAVKPQWIDTAGALTGKSETNSLITAEFPPGTKYYYGPVSSQGGVYVGGPDKMQIFVPDARRIGVFTVKGPLP